MPVLPRAYFQTRLAALLTVAALYLCASLPPAEARPGRPGSPAAAERGKSGKWASAKRCTKQWIRSRCIDSGDLEGYGLRIQTRLDAAGQPPLVVFVVHGFNSSRRGTSTLTETIREAGFAVGTFAYPNDHELAASARLLAGELRRFKRKHPHRSAALVTHSMGGLVARACIEDPKLDPGNIERLIMIAPPSHGTLLTHCARGMDLWEHGFSGKGAPWSRVKGSVVDGLAEAVDDLRPGSPFLVSLNRRPRNPSVAYTVMLGTAGRARQEDMQVVRGIFRNCFGRIPLIGRCARRTECFLGQVDEIVRGKGDGLVAVRRGRLAGVEDTLVMPFGHSSVLGPPRTDAVRHVHAAILSRLGSSHPRQVVQPKSEEEDPLAAIH